ncbi:MAG: hypothetical protein ABI685_04810 [Ferruginibacter sp.]
MIYAYLDIKYTAKDNTENKKGPANFIQADDIYHNTAAEKTYLAAESDNRKRVRKGSTHSMIMLDIFGALNY